MAVFVVLPRGSFRGTSSSVVEELGSLGQEFSGSVGVTEDYEGAWTRTFGVEKAPATYLMDARGEFVWQQAGQLVTYSDPEFHLE